MPTPINELVDELGRLKPGSPDLRTFTDVADGIEWWNSLRIDERAFWLCEATTRNKRAWPSAADAWAEYKRQRAFDRLAHNVVALLNQ